MSTIDYDWQHSISRRQNVLELLQSELGRTLGSLGAPDLASLTRAMIRIHQR